MRVRDFLAAGRRLLSPSRWRLRYHVDLLASLNGVFPRQCPCCGQSSLFEATGMPPRLDALCKRCGSLERHRLFVLICEQRGLLHGAREVAPFAPEDALHRYLESRVASYLTCDLSAAGVDRTENIERTTFDDRSFDMAIVCHVLEHVDDSRALPELFRILRPGGRLVVMVPIVEGWSETYEDPKVLSEELRTLHFGQHDHVRYYGRDFRDRVRTAGFALAEYTAQGREVIEYGLLRGEKVFVATRPTASKA